MYVRAYTGRTIYTFLNWDMFLAWVPVGFACMLHLVFYHMQPKQWPRTLLITVVGLLWLLFFPNSAYLITDMLHLFIHFKPEPGVRFTHDIEFWYHLILFFSAALIGVLLSFYSLYTVQQVVKKAYGAATSWAFAIIVLLLSSFGIYIGRFVRWNSWDVFVRPDRIVQDIVMIVTDEQKLKLFVPFVLILFAVQGFVHCVLSAIATFHSKSLPPK
ncbi:DUF1361 domain-containing protein [Paenibacillus sp. 481]|uniref:DUF1361 domain-containing protein n=1 Tax=Paenibacillus sp. 481 TaxID=2835869 RepID=UPI001E3B3C78|nr:DUF1361 domain-containing protein [Paenibacillus sp. 481]UHA74583.1 DUF1361 domain-containing protein [Paenibacillus sp. 481]